MRKNYSEVTDDYIEFAYELLEIIKAVLPKRLCVDIHEPTGTYIFSRLMSEKTDPFGYQPSVEAIYNPFKIYRDLRKKEGSVYELVDIGKIVGKILSAISNDREIYGSIISKKYTFEDIKENILPVIADRIEDSSDLMNMPVSEAYGLYVIYKIYMEFETEGRTFRYLVPVTDEIMDALEITDEQLYRQAKANLAKFAETMKIDDIRVITFGENTAKEKTVQFLFPVKGLAFFISDSIMQKISDTFQSGFYLYAIGRNYAYVMDDMFENSPELRKYARQKTYERYMLNDNNICISPELLYYDRLTGIKMNTSIYDKVGKLYAPSIADLMEGLEKYRKKKNNGGSDDYNYEAVVV